MNTKTAWLFFMALTLSACSTSHPLTKNESSNKRNDILLVEEIINNAKSLDDVDKLLNSNRETLEKSVYSQDIWLYKDLSSGYQAYAISVDQKKKSININFNPNPADENFLIDSLLARWNKLGCKEYRFNKVVAMHSHSTVRGQICNQGKLKIALNRYNEITGIDIILQSN